ncbi:hypothetical protein AURDEDRAFT_174311 [Auricularia subglabra TFB-10046 SS5]|nr:hypothetical protein AURDEDRAFT_174311 [Auricularia subglabra TFB-10046 SS5]
MGVAWPMRDARVLVTMWPAAIPRRMDKEPQEPRSQMPVSDTASNASTVTQVSRKGLLQWHEIYDGMIGRAAHSVKHAIVNALTSVIPPSSLAPDSLLLRDLENLDTNRGKFRPFIVLEKPRGREIPARIALMTHFNKRPIQEVDAAAQALAVALGTETPPWPTETSARICISPKWEDKNSYVLAFAIKLDAGRHPKRYRSAGVTYQVEPEELELLRELCEDRAEMLEEMSPEQLAELRQSYETHVATYKLADSSFGGSVYTTAQSQMSILPSISEDAPTATESAEDVVAAAGPRVPTTESPDVDEEGFTLVKPKGKRRKSTIRSERR